MHASVLSIIGHTRSLQQGRIGHGEYVRRVIVCLASMETVTPVIQFAELISLGANTRDTGE